MNSIIHKIRFSFDDPLECLRIRVKYQNQNKKEEAEWFREVNGKEWETVLHPDSDWCLFMSFDEHALPDDLYRIYEREKEVLHAYEKNEHSNVTRSRMTAWSKIQVNRLEYFSKKATLREVMERITQKSFCCGFYKDIRIMNGYEIEKEIPKEARDEIQESAGNIYRVHWSLNP